MSFWRISRRLYISDVGKNLYLFYLIFFGLTAIFPVGADYVIQTYGLLDIGFFTPPSSLNPWILACVFSLFSVGLIYWSKRTNNTERLEYFSVASLRYCLAFVMIVVYGYCKIVTKQFQIRYSALDIPLKDVSDFDLAWYFYGRSNVQTLLLGFLELIPGILLLWKRTTLPGALILLPVIGNIALLDNFNDVGPHLNVFSIVFLLFDLGILLYYRKEILRFLTSTRHKLGALPFKSGIKKLLVILKVLFILVIIYRFGKGVFGAMQERTELSKSKSKCFGTFELQRISYNNKNYVLDSLPNYWKRLYFEKIDSRNTRLLDRYNKMVNIGVEFSAHPDSITIATYDRLDGKENPVGLAVFSGTYILSENDSILTLNGKRNDTLVRAIYKKLPIDGRDWWW